jgi:hypothetical protein
MAQRLAPARSQQNGSSYYYASQFRGLRKFFDGLELWDTRVTRAKTPRTQSDGQGPSSRADCEGSEKDFSLRSK